MINQNDINTTTPKTITSVVEDFCRSIAPDTPVYVPIHPEPNAQIGECFFNVQEKVAASGGDIVYGWNIWEWPRVYIEAEHHAVWRSPDGDLIDVTPQPDGEGRILFLPDQDKVYDWEGHKRTDNRRQAIADDPLVEEYLKLSAEMVTYMESNSTGRIVTLQKEDILPLLAKQNDLLGYIKKKYSRTSGRASSNKIGRNDPCSCGSGKKYKKCCLLANAS
jgi:hypothetical protein